MSICETIFATATNPLGLPALLNGAAAGIYAFRYIGKVCCLLLVQADYIRQRPLARVTHNSKHSKTPFCELYLQNTAKAICKSCKSF